LKFLSRQQATGYYGISAPTFGLRHALCCEVAKSGLIPAASNGEFKFEQTKTKARSPQINVICERFHKTVNQEFYQVTFRKKVYRDLESQQLDLEHWMGYYNNERTHQEKICCGRIPMETLEDGKSICREKMVS